MTSFLLFAFLTGTLLSLGVASMLQRPAGASRLARIAAGGEQTVPTSRRAQLEALLAPIAARFGGASAEIRSRLVQAGFRDESSVVIYVGLRVALPAVLVFGAFLAGSVLGEDPSRQLVALLIAGIVGYVGPSYWIDKRRKQRQTEIRCALPDALDLLVVCLEAGLSLGAGIARVAQEFVRSSPSLCQELRLVTAEMQAGKGGADALRAFAERVGIQEVSALSAMLIQTERFGTCVSDALRVHCQGMRQDRLQKAEEIAQKAAVKMILPACVFIFPATLLVLVGPAGLRLIAALTGSP
jgi:tight adherence protein C